MCGMQERKATPSESSPTTTCMECNSTVLISAWDELKSAEVVVKVQSVAYNLTIN